MRRNLATLALAMISATLIGQLSATPGHAAVIPPSKTVDTALATVGGRVPTSADQAYAQLLAYWTPERMRAAELENDPVGGVADPALERLDRPGNPGPELIDARPAAPLASLTSPGGSGAPGARASQSSADTLDRSKGVGRVFFTKANGKDAACSGSTINNPTGNMVSTAGHCVHGGKGSAWHDNWIYVPYYYDGLSPLGIWPAKWYTSPDGWTHHSYYWWDFAFVNVWPVAGKRLVDKAGGNGIVYNYSKWSAVTLFGYPAEPPYDGTDQWYCQGDMYPYGTQQVGFNCLLTGGASGGPWFRGYDSGLGLGFVASVISHGPDDKNYGPYFDNDVHDFYNAAKNK